MSNFSKDQPSIRVFAPPGGRSNNIFGVPEPEAPVTTKKNHMESDIFGCKKDNTDSTPVKQTSRPVTNNIFGSAPEHAVPKPSVYSEKNRSTIFDEAPPTQPSYKPDRQRSNIFGSNEPVQSTPTRPVSEKYKSSIFANGDADTQNKRQSGTRQGLRGRLHQTTYQDNYRPSIAISIYSPLRLKDPNASRMGYNPINGEPYSSKDGLDSKVEQEGPVPCEQESNGNAKTPEEENGQDKAIDNSNNEPSIDNGNVEICNGKQTNGHTNGTNGHTNGINGHTTTKNSNTSVRVVHPPGGRSNGPLW